MVVFAEVAAAGRENFSKRDANESFRGPVASCRPYLASWAALKSQFQVASPRRLSPGCRMTPSRLAITHWPTESGAVVLEIFLSCGFLLMRATTSSSKLCDSGLMVTGADYEAGLPYFSPGMFRDETTGSPYRGLDASAQTTWTL